MAADIIVALIMITLAFVGIISSVFSVKIIYRTKFFHNAFGSLSIAQAVADSGFCILYGIYAGVLCLFSSSNETTPENYAFGLFAMYFNCFAEMLLLTKTANRLLAVICPLFYHQRFTTKVAIALIFIEAIIAALNMIPYITTGCYMFFSTEVYFWTIEEECSNALQVAGWFHKGTVLGVIVGTLIFDGITLFYLLAFKNKYKNNNSKKHQREKKLFFQTFSITVIHTFALLTMYVFSKLISNKFDVFLLKTPPFLIFHAGNEFTFLLVNVSLKTTTNSSSTTPPVKWAESRGSSRMLTIS